ncbi:MAG TPA: flagellar basal-body rod protein FlgG [Noviherbaspirillum sp.]|nr:flagellar basal-body rod protein FlgG [Noviherbaspirillum sp.]
MNDSLYIAATGMLTQQMNVDTIANNLANVNTPGFKKGRVSFQDLVYREAGQTALLQEGQSTGSLARGTGVGVLSLSKLFTSGELKRTDAPLDVAIQGEGFFEVALADGTHAYSRGGTFQVNRDGMLTTSEGHLLKPGIHVGFDYKEIAIKSDGRVLVRARDQKDATEVGRIELVNFGDLSGLAAMGENLYRPTERSGDAIYGRPGEDGWGAITQGFIESSNVKLVDEMVNLMVAQRAYEMSVKVIQASDEMLAMSNNLRR